MSGRLEPNLFIPGTQKGGTTTLYRLLKRHPQCLFSRPKEPNVFTDTERLSEPDPFGDFFEETGDRPTDHYDILGEASTAYMNAHGVPRRMSRWLSGEVKFIFLLRDPVQRAISAFWHLAKKNEDNRTIRDVFEFQSDSPSDVMQEETEKIKQAEASGRIRTERLGEKYDDYRWAFRYVTNSFYSYHMKRFREYFPRENMFIVFSEQLFDQPKNVLHRVERFLGIDRFTPGNLTQRYNPTEVPRKHRVAQYLRNTLRPLMPDWIREQPLLKRWYRAIVYRGKPEPPENVIQNLRSLLVPEVRSIRNQSKHAGTLSWTNVETAPSSGSGTEPWTWFSETAHSE